MRMGVIGEWYRWLVLTLLTLLLVLGSTVVNRDVYSKEQTDALVRRTAEEVVGMHERDVSHISKQLDRVEGQVDKLVDHLIGGND